MYPVRRGFFTAMSSRCDIFRFYLHTSESAFAVNNPLKLQLAAMLMLLLPAFAFAQATHSTGSGQAAPGSAQAYPVKPLRIVVPFQSGGSVEPVARLVAQKLTAAYGRAVV